MQPHTILTIYIAFFLLEFLLEQVISLVNIRHVSRRREEPPEEVRRFIDTDRFRKAASYTIDKGRFGIVSALWSSAFVLIVVSTGGLGWFESMVGRLDLPGYLHGIGFVLLLSLVFGLSGLPFSVYAQFGIEKRYGFNTMSVRTFVLDLVKGAVLSAVLATPLLAVLFWFMDSAGSLWWIWGFLFVVSFQLLVSFLYPTVIAPLFNKFTPLEEGELRTRLLTLADTLDFPTRGVFVMDGSKRSSHSNAYFTGFGKARRIVLYDTLIDSLTPAQLEGVLAHEIGHFKLRHVWKRLAVSTVLLLCGFLILNGLLGWEPLYAAFGFRESSYHAMVVILAFCSGPFTFFLTPLFTSWSRRHEYAADGFAGDAVGSSRPLIDALVKLGVDNLANFTPHRLYSFYHYSHPTVLERVAAMED